METEDLTGKAGTLEPGAETAEAADAAAGTLEPGDGTTGTAATEERRVRIKVGDEERELTEAELIDSAQQALGHKLSLEQRNAELAEARRARAAAETEREYYQRQTFDRLEGPAAAPAGRAAPAYDQDVTQGLDPNDARDREIIEIRKWRREQDVAAHNAKLGRQIQTMLEGQARTMASNPDKYPGYDEARCVDVMRKQIEAGKKLDFFDAYKLDYAERMPEIQRQQREQEAAEEAAKKKAAADAARNGRTLDVASASGSARPRQENVISPERVVAMPLKQFKELKEKGWVPDPRGNGGLVRPAAP